jgi:hypothetical protein
MERAPVIDNPGAKSLTNGGVAAFVDNVDTRARRKIHVALSFCYICRLDGSFALLGRGTTVAIDNIDKAASGPSAEGIPKNLV